jgi:cell division initiation protein
MLKTDEFSLNSSTLPGAGTPESAAAPELRRLPGVERNLGVSPLDMRQAKFGTSMRGFDKTEVTAFLLEAADSYEQALRDNERLRQDLLRLEASLHQFRELEGSLKSTLMSAQKVADDMRENAQQEAARIQRDAEGRSELMLQKAQARMEDVQREIDGLKLKRREAEISIESTISALRNTLEYVREQDQRDQAPKQAAHAFQIVK